MKAAGFEKYFEEMTYNEQREAKAQDLANQLSDFVLPNGQPITNNPKESAINLMNKGKL